MKELQEQFEGKGEVKGYDFRQLVQTPYGYIYERTDNEGHLSFEVFKRVENTQFNVISYPKSKSFGKWAWNVATIEKAMKKLEEIEQNEIQKLTA